MSEFVKEWLAEHPEHDEVLCDLCEQQVGFQTKDGEAKVEWCHSFTPCMHGIRKLVEDERGRRTEAIGVIERFGGIDGGHHKQWVLDQVLRKLLGDDYDEWRRAYDSYTDENGDTYSSWEEGCPP